MTLEFSLDTPSSAIVFLSRLPTESLYPGVQLSVPVFEVLDADYAPETLKVTIETHGDTEASVAVLNTTGIQFLVDNK